MKFKQYIRTISLILLLALGGNLSVLGCGEPYTDPAYLKIFKVQPQSSDSDSDLQLYNYRAMDNCRLWAKQTYSKINIWEIHEVVYEWYAYQIESLIRNIDKPEEGNTLLDNEFARWIVDNKDYEVAQFLLLAKRCEETRMAQNHPWYYPANGDEVSMSLHEVAKEAAAYKGYRLRSRYALQAMRALFASGRHDECVNYWGRINESLDEDLLKHMCRPYVAGSLLRLGQKEESLKMYAQADDVNSIISITDKSLDPNNLFNRLEALYKYNPDSEQFPKIIQREVSKFEEEKYGDYYSYNPKRVASLCEFATKVAHEGRCKNRAMWYYTASFLNYLLDNPTQAFELLSESERYKADAVVDSSIRSLRLLLDAKYSPLNPATERRIYNDINWLLESIRNSAYEPVDWYCTISWSNYRDNYWCRILSRVLLSELAPRYFAKGDYIRGIQLVNMADNALLNIVGELISYSYVPMIDKYINLELPVSQMRESRFVTNDIDYSNSLFVVADTIAVEKLQRYVDVMNDKHSSPMDELARLYSYTNPDFFNEIIATRLLRECRYAEAVKYFRMLPENFHRRLNTYKCGNLFKCNPFSERVVSPSDNVKYNFAVKMVQLEKQIEQTTEPNTKADLKLEYALAMRQSLVEEGWALTRYYWGIPCYFLIDQMGDRWDIKPDHIARVKKCDELIKEALRSYTYNEAAAAAYRRMGFYKSVLERFPDTRTAADIRRRCDNLRDYKPN